MMMLDCKGGGRVKNLGKSDYVICKRFLIFVLNFKLKLSSKVLKIARFKFLKSINHYLISYRFV